jgi:hypothetical protein
MMRSAALAVILITALTAASAPQPTLRKVDEHEKSSDAADKMICKRFIEMGSLVKGYRTCKTKRDWERERDAVRSNTHSANSCANQAEVGSC